MFSQLGQQCSHQIRQCISHTCCTRSACSHHISLEKIHLGTMVCDVIVLHHRVRRVDLILIFDTKSLPMQPCSSVFRFSLAAVNISLWKRIWGSTWRISLLVVESSLEKEPRVIVCSFYLKERSVIGLLCIDIQGFYPYFNCLISIYIFVCNYTKNYVVKRFVSQQKGFLL